MPEISLPPGEVFPTLKNNILVDGFHIVIDLEKSHGSWIHDARTYARKLTGLDLDQPR